MGMEVDPNRNQDKMRLCPSCRMEISVLAVKCRYCGEEVGRPKDEQRHYTATDLGGETIEHYAPSSSVMEALESFRSEEGVRKDVYGEKKAPGTSVFERRKGPKETPPPAKTSDDLPELDEHSRLLASSVSVSSPAFVRGGPKKKENPWGKRVAMLAAGVAALLILYYGGGAAYGVIRNWSLGEAVGQGEYDNPAAAMLARGENPVEALEVAVAFHQRYKTADAAAVVAQARERVIEQVEGLLGTRQYNRQNHAEALRLVSRAHGVEASPEMRNLKQQVEIEIRAHATGLVRTDRTASPPQITVRITNTNQTTSDVTVRQGDTFFDGRFQVDVVRENEAGLTDLRTGRKLRLTRAEGIIP
jgi:ribosomal protein L40E